MIPPDRLTPAQRRRRDALSARRDALIPLDPRVYDDDMEFLPTMLDILADDAKSPNDLLDAIERHVRELETKYGPAVPKPTHP